MRKTGVISMVSMLSATLMSFTATTAQATVVEPYTIQEVLKLRQNKFPVAGDLKLKFWQKEDDVEVVDWEVQGTSGGLPMPDSQNRGSQPGKYNTTVNKLHSSSSPDADNGNHAVDLAWDDLDLAEGSEVDIKFKWTLTEYNVKHKAWEWSKKEDHTVIEKGGAKVGVTVDDPKPEPDPVPGDKKQWIHTVNILNLDSWDEIDPMSILIHDLKYWAMPDNTPLDIAVLANWSTWSDPFPDILLSPGDSFTFDVITPNRNSRILGDYSGFDPAVSPQAQADEWLLQDTWDHTAPIPEPSFFMMLLAGLVPLFLRKRYQDHAKSNRA